MNCHHQQIELKWYPWHQTCVVVFGFLCFTIAQQGAECGDGAWSLTLLAAAQLLMVISVSLIKL